MFKKLFIFNISASLLLSMPVIAVNPQDSKETLLAAHHHHHDKHQHEKEIIKEIVVEVKAKERSTAGKIAAGLLQFVNKTAGRWAFLASIAIMCRGPFFTNSTNSDDCLMLAIGQGICLFFILWPTIQYGTAAAMKQEDIKPLKD